ncbi:hypothetical protein AN958_08313 [Leucoagaricus sp. SymC.cos]|nr:hypothetical protein AN958_08313 [Leucoagaricus sp. SymC.cos]
MVASRKKASAPAPPTSRTNSTQALPRAVNAQLTHSNPSNASDNHSDSPQTDGKDVLPQVPNGTLKSTHKANSQQSKDKTPLTRKEKRSLLLDRIFYLFLATFSIYALYTCPFDSNDENSVCHSLSTYRTHVLEPYVIPPIRSAINHPAVVQPYEKYAKPVYQSYIEPVTPYVAAAQRRTAPYVTSAIRLSQNTTSRIWRTVVKRCWTRAVVPRYNAYLRPYVNKYVSPLIKRTQYYNHQAEPYVRSFAHHTSICAHTAQKYALFTYERTRPHVARAYDIMKPYAVRGYAQAKPLVSKITDVAQSKGKYAVSEAVIISQVVLGRVGDLRREFVDPHVLRIWEKAVEKSGPSSSTVVPESSIIESIPSSSTDEPIQSMEQPETSEVSTPDVPAAILEDSLSKAASVAEASAAHASNIITEMEGKIKEASATQAHFEAISDPVESPAPTPIENTASEQLVLETPVTTPQETTASALESEELDDFLREIGLDEEEKVPEPEPVLLPTAEEDQEDQEAKKAATAAKRADIVGRHVRWQSELDSLVKDLEQRVQQNLETIREEAISYIGKLPSDRHSSAAHGKGKEVIDKVQNDGEKLLKGLESYVNKLTSQMVVQEDLKEKEKWNKVVDKVEDKFKVVVRGIQEEVHDWYIQIREKEALAVSTAANEVKALADRAQADLGLNYAWLDDVTYYDWQNYHDLMRTYERFEQTARSLQNGTHTSAPEDKLIPLLNNLDREVQDMIKGFAIRMTGLVREGDRWLSSAHEPEPRVEDEDEEDEYEGDEAEDEPQVSILPISPQPSTEKVDPANVVIGKNAEQIEKMAQQAVVDQRIEL